jgi:hypothetical protein
LPLPTVPAPAFPGAWKTGWVGVGFGALSESLRAARGLRRRAAEMVKLAPLGRKP